MRLVVQLFWSVESVVGRSSTNLVTVRRYKAKQPFRSPWLLVRNKIAVRTSECCACVYPH